MLLTRIVYLFVGVQAVVPAWATSNLSFQVTSGGNENYFLRDNLTSAQVLLTSANSLASLRRLVVALPAGNSGVLTYFLPLSNSSSNDSLSVTIQNDSLTSTSEELNNVGIQGNLSFNASATVGVTIIGAVRAMRDYVEGSGTMHEIFNYTLASYNSSSVRLHRQWINATSNGTFRSADVYLNTLSGAQLNVTPGNNGTTAPPTIDILVEEGGSGIMQLRVVTNETSLTGLAPEDLFLSEGTGNNSALDTALTGLADGSSPAAQQVSFLTYHDKFTAGGWRFLTYFGRDSMIALRLLMPTLTPNAIESALGAVIERVNTTGALCHEETIGEWMKNTGNAILILSEFRRLCFVFTYHCVPKVNIGNSRSDLGNQPFYDYKMIDTDLFFLPTLAHYFLDLPQGNNTSSSFLDKNATLQNGTYRELLNSAELDRTIFYNLGRAIPFGRNSTVANLLAFRPGQPVGNWRDSNQGTGYGPIPFDVNTALVPASLRSTARLAKAGIIGNSVPVLTLEDGSNYDANSSLADIADSLAAVWEEKSLPFFEVTLDNETAQERLRNFINETNLSEALLDDITDVSEASNKTFYALSLKEDGSSVEVLNSDIGFSLLYGNNVTQSFLQRVIEALQPYPRGLLTNIGMVVANPAYDSNTTNIDVFNNAAYHGTVIWSWQQGMMASGLKRQLGYCTNATNSTVDTNPSPANTPEWCGNTTFVQSISDAQQRLWSSIKGAVDEIYSEVWTYSFNNSTNTFSVADLASLSGGTESDAIQLWSYGFLGLLDPSGERIG
ncbi:uncharacterized protein FOMMEDRAFT_144208 [Fomitiporia mediterranea MF3/22]|uniref:uncharacterized protein n=1 Tax=Fomitiporia mediterranea (strain MF3/22) TaxID=694068 RepID=UPI00044074D1|nr:uncharacterized protein FOMMEDRAFT_144208 [Fomitiporia mediterranea MF3/22]EJD08148.1 hypothetical protein FOMMEDRAFT_144208 [Fomitiporia mediterranea MF3/22]